MPRSDRLPCESTIGIGTLDATLTRARVLYEQSRRSPTDKQLIGDVVRAYEAARTILDEVVNTIRPIGPHRGFTAGDEQLRFNAASFGADFADLAAKVVWTEPCDGNGEIANAAAVLGCIAVVSRGGCSFVDKARRVQDAGGVAVAIVNTDDRLFAPAGSADDVHIPVIGIGLADAGRVVGKGVVSLQANLKELRRFKRQLGVVEKRIKQLNETEPVFEAPIRAPQRAVDSDIGTVGAGGVVSMQELRAAKTLAAKKKHHVDSPAVTGSANANVNDATKDSNGTSPDKPLGKQLASKDVNELRRELRLYRADEKRLRDELDELRRENRQLQRVYQLADQARVEAEDRVKVSSDAMRQLGKVKRCELVCSIPFHELSYSVKIDNILVAGSGVSTETS